MIKKKVINYADGVRLVVILSDVSYLEETLEDEFYDKIGTANFYTDMIDFNAIDWQEIRDSLDPEDEEELTDE